MLATTMMLLMMTAALAGCAGSDITQDDVDDARAEGLADGIAQATTVSTLDLIHQRGDLRCGVKTEQWGMGYRADENSSYQGLDVDYCKAIAAAIGLDPEKDVTYVYASGQERFNLLKDGTNILAEDYTGIDVLIRTTTWTASRDADQNGDFAAINFYDGQNFLVNGDVLPNDGTPSIYDLSGASICVATGTTTESNLQDWISDWDTSLGPAPTAVLYPEATPARAGFTGGECSAYTGDSSAMGAYKWQLDGSGDPTACQLKDSNDACVDLWIPSEFISKEPLTAVVRDYDTEWKEVVQWVWYGMVTAEEMGITSDNHAAVLSSATVSAAETRFLSASPWLGTENNPVAPTFMQDVLNAVGNYGEAYDRAFCDGTYDGHSGSTAMVDCVIPRANTQNALVSEGGLMFAPAWK